MLRTMQALKDFIEKNKDCTFEAHWQVERDCNNFEVNQYFKIIARDIEEENEVDYEYIGQTMMKTLNDDDAIQYGDVHWDDNDTVIFYVSPEDIDFTKQLEID